MKTILRICFIATMSVLMFGGLHLTAQNQSKTTVKPKNIIFMIGDGMGLAEVQAAQHRATQPLNMFTSKHIGLITTHSFDDEITDSGAGGTALATGKKTRNRMIGMTADSVAFPSLLEVFAAEGKSTGVAVSCAVTHATPASFVAKVNSRYLYEDIALQYLQSPIDVVIGGGLKDFNKRKDGRTLTDEMQEKGFHYANVIPDKPIHNASKLLILTDSSHPKSVLMGRGDHLIKATKLAIETLNQNPNGFFLMVEGSQIDFGGHDNNIDYIVSEVFDFDAAVGVALEFIKNNPETLLIITADHETGGLSFPGSAVQGTLRSAFSTTDHSGIMVPVYAFGAGAETFTGVYDNTEIFSKILSLTGLKVK